MEMKSHLLSLFQFQDTANRKLIAKIGEMPDPSEAIHLLSHLIHSQDKWLVRLARDPVANQREWFGPPFPYEQLETEWTRSLNAWLTFLEGKTEAEIDAPVRFEGQDGAQYEVKLSDLALQLNFHGVHHRAQIQTLVRQQGLKPDFLDYIAGRYKKVE